MEPTTFTPDEMIDLRRFCGFAAAGQAPTACDARERFFLIRLEQLSDAEEAKIKGVFLPRCAAMETAYWEASAPLVVEAAGDFTRNPEHLAEAKEMYRDARLQLCAFMGIAPGRSLETQLGTRFVTMRV